MPKNVVPDALTAKLKDCYNNGEETAPDDIGFQYLMELTTEEKRELIKMWKERNNVSEQKKIR